MIKTGFLNVSNSRIFGFFVYLKRAFVEDFVVGANIAYLKSCASRIPSDEETLLCRLKWIKRVYTD